MRRGLIAWLLVASTGVFLDVTSASAQTAPPSDSQAYGGLIQDGAQVGASHNEYGAGTGTPPASSGQSPYLSCRRLTGSGATATDGDFSRDQLEVELAEARANGRDRVQVQLICTRRDGTTANTTFFYPSGPGQPVVPPDVIAEQAERQIHFPAPDGQMSPSLETGSVAQLEAYFYMYPWVWTELAAQAEAGPVVATATATPVSQTWVITDARRGLDYDPIVCDVPGVPFEEIAAGSTEPPCTWIPPHSSAGQPVPPGGGPACFHAEVTMTWNVAWTSTVGGAPGPSGSFAPQSRTATTCIVVKEVQAVVTGDPGD